jgi:hypothetical protein
MLVAIKIALCLALTNKAEALSLLQPILQCEYLDVRNYAEIQSRMIYEDEIQAVKKKIKNNVLDVDTAEYSFDFECRIFI